MALQCLNHARSLARERRTPLPLKPSFLLSNGPRPTILKANNASLALDAEPSSSSDDERERYIPSRDPTTHRNFFDYLGKKLGVTKYEDWYKLKVRDILEHGGNKVIAYYLGSPSRALSAVYPEYEWKPLLFDKVYNGYWLDRTNQRNYMDWLGKRIGIQRMEDWYNLEKADLLENGGAGLWRMFLSQGKLLKFIYPEFEWEDWRFYKNRNESFWRSPVNQRKYMDWVGEQLKIDSPEGWYNVTSTTIQNLGGFSILKRYNRETSKMLQSIYVDYDWDPDKFITSRKFRQEAMKIMASAVSEKLKISGVEDWYRVSEKQVISAGGRSLITNGLARALSVIYPNVSWDKERFRARGKRAAQRWMAVQLKEMFPNMDVIEEFVSESILLPTSKIPLELDVYIPELKLAFEYQGIQHYSDIYYFGVHRLYQTRDEEKKKVCEENGITLIHVPYWWDNTRSSLEQTIHETVPKLVKAVPDAVAIPLSPPTTQWKTGNAMFMLSDDFTPEESPAGWWMSEKLDGIRAYWDTKKLISRQGRVITAPQWFLEKLPPNMALDGELWLGRGTFQNIVNLTKNYANPEWENISYQVFDAPQVDLPFEDRHQLLSLVANDRVCVVEIKRCNGMEDLEQFMKDIVSNGGEGVMLRKPGSSYEIGRSSSLLKVKPYPEAEVRVVGIHEKSGSLICEQTNGQLVFVQCGRQVYLRPPTKGTVVTVTYTSRWRSGKLRYPVFSRIREDLTWNEAKKEDQSKKESNFLLESV